MFLPLPSLFSAVCTVATMNLHDMKDLFSFLVFELIVDMLELVSTCFTDQRRQW